MKILEPQPAVKQIQQRLAVSLLGALAIVVTLVIILTLGSTIFFINRGNRDRISIRPLLSSVLESYYLGHGSWEGIEAVPKIVAPTGPEDIVSEWRNSYLLDVNGRVVIAHGDPHSPENGSVYQAQAGQLFIPLLKEGEPIGTLIVTMPPGPPEFLPPQFISLGLTAAFLGLLTLVIGLILSRRILNPLAEVIAASQAVTSGNLSTRVKVQGPDDLRALSDSFNQMASALERHDREQRDMIADIAHELRTPLSILQGKLEGIVDGIYPADDAHLGSILEETYLLERLIEDLDTLAQAASRQLPFHQEAFNLGDVCSRTVANFEGEAAEKKISIIIDEEANVPAVMGDMQRTGQVVANLIANAIRYIPEGSRVDVKIKAVLHRVELVVNDDGPGIPPDDLPFIFDRFWRGEKSRSRALGGAGLGLAIARQFVEIQGGMIWAANLPEGGLQVGFSLPAGGQ
jgi:signal transduction histidine kinase